MARLVFGSFERTVQPAWMGDFAGRDYLIPGGAHVDESAFSADADGFKYIPSGTLVGRTYAERDAGDAFGPADDADDEIYLIAYDVDDAAVNPDVVLYRHGGVVKENMLPEWDTWEADLTTYQATIDAVRANYTTTKGVE